MKKLILPLFAILFLISCEKESSIEILQEKENMEDINLTTRSSNKRKVCHNGNIINININAIPAHQAHGDAVDMDGDGFFDIDNPCSVTDCDDTDAELTDNCSVTCIEGELEVTLPDGSILYVYPIDNSTNIEWGESGIEIPGLPDITNTASANLDFNGAANTTAIVAGLGGGNYAANLCANLSAQSDCDWYLPAVGELNALYQQLGPTTNGFNGTGDMQNEYYWSSTSANINGAWLQYFDDGSQFDASKSGNLLSCRCVRR